MRRLSYFESVLRTHRVASGRMILCLLAFAALGLSVSARSEDDKPIIAVMLAAPGSFDGRTVTIYGLVIETENAGRAFLLQDVSQMPLKVVRKDGLPTLVGDQLLIRGTFIARATEPHLVATRIKKTKVLGGGGCC